MTGLFLIHFRDIWFSSFLLADCGFADLFSNVYTTGDTNSGDPRRGDSPPMAREFASAAIQRDCFSEKFRNGKPGV
jgi:hypothetical protein